MLLVFLLSSVRGQAGEVACKSGFDHFPFCNTSMAIEDRVHDLVSRIKDEDKPNLLTARGQPRHNMQALPYLGVPYYYWGHNCIHSSMFSNCTKAGRCSTSFPAGPNFAATFDREAMRKMAVVVGGAEDPYLMGELGAAWTTGLQKGDGKDTEYVQVAVTLKHFDANSLEGGSPNDKGLTRHTVDVNLTNYLLTDYYWPAFRKSIKDAHAKGVMCSYNSVNGVPTCLSPLMKAAREAWNFDGYVTSDSDSIADAYQAHHYVNSAAAASCAGVKAGGCDIDSGGTYVKGLAAGVAQGLCKMEDLDRALFNTFKVRFELGLFDPPTSEYWSLGESDIGTDAAKALNLESTMKSLVLLTNGGGGGEQKVLPFKTGSKVAVLGPHGNASEALIQVDTGKICPGVDHKINGGHPVFGFDCVETPLHAIAAANAGGTTTYAEGTAGLYAEDYSGIPAAVSVAKDADYVVMGLGIDSKGDGTAASAPYHEEETHDREDIGLPPVQLALAKAIIAVKKPTVIFLLNGGAVDVPQSILAAPNVAVIEA
eukprot:gene18335-2827_t